MTTPAPGSADRLALLYHLSQTFNSSLDLDEVLNRVMDEVITATRAERGFVMLHEAGERLAFRVARGIDRTTIDDPSFQISRSVVEQVAHEGEPVLTSDAQRDARFNLRQSVTLLGLRSILCVPLKVKDNLLGVIYVDNRMQTDIFTFADLELLTAIASSAAIAIENARLYQVAVEKGRLDAELQTARKVQTGLLPRSIPQQPGWEFAVRWQPARQVGGDYYDFIQDEAGNCGLLIADVTDKGMPAALFMAFTRSVVRASLLGAPSPAAGIARANRLICADSDDSLFVTLFYAQIDPADGRLAYVNAGHNPALLYQFEPDRLQTLIRTGMPMGIEEDAAYEQRTLEMGQGDFILLYTDGVTDALDAQGQDFGDERLHQVVMEYRKASSAELADGLLQAIVDFAGSTAPFDDLTLVIARRG